MKKSILLFLILFIYNTQGISQEDYQILSPEVIVSFIPNNIEGFYSSTDSKSKVIKIGTIRYSMAERNFSAKRKRSIKILLFDYQETPIMYSQATRKWSTYTAVESDSLIVRPTIILDCPGLESYNVQTNNSQILVGVYNRFFLTLEGVNVDLEFLRRVLQGFKFETFPKLNTENPKFR